ncbi:MAG: hypothetical protein JNM00_10925, partial [Flavobacteriales bacterium]|nr:hypothetical protein [Flavobacteriales bacterium]
DTTAPVVVLIDSPIEAPCDALPEPAIEVTDDCSNVFIEVSDEVSIAGCPGQIIRTYTITDACGNANTASQVINLIPDDGPFFVNFPENLVLECSPDIDIPAVDVQFEGACSNPSLNISEEVIPGECGGEYQIIRTYTLTDDCGNVVQQTWTIDVVDTTPPTLVNIPEGIELQCGESLPDAFVFAVDNCDSDPVVGVSASTQQLECGFAFIRTWFAVDDCGNTTELTEQVVVNDDVAPYFTSVPSDIEWPCDQPLPESTAAAADDCSLVSVTYSDESTGEGCETVIVRTFTATDGCGNATTAVQHIALFDNLAPVISEVPGDATISCGDAIPEGYVVVTDNCDQLPEVSVSEVVVQADCGYTIVRTWTAIDACGNSASASQEIVVTDNQAPVFTYIPADAFYPCNTFVPLLMAEASD